MDVAPSDDLLRLDLNALNATLGNISDLAGTNLSELIGDDWLTDPMMRRLRSVVSKFEERDFLIFEIDSSKSESHSEKPARR